MRGRVVGVGGGGFPSGRFRVIEADQIGVTEQFAKRICGPELLGAALRDGLRGFEIDCES